MADCDGEATLFPLRTAAEQRTRAIGRPFQPGISGNPGGRPKVAGKVRDLAKRAAPEAFARLVELMRSQDERVALVAIKEVLDRAYGRPAPMPPETPAATKVQYVVQWQHEKSLAELE